MLDIVVLLHIHGFLQLTLFKQLVFVATIFKGVYNGGITYSGAYSSWNSEFQCVFTKSVLIISMFILLQYVEAILPSKWWLSSCWLSPIITHLRSWLLRLPLFVYGIIRVVHMEVILVSSGRCRRVRLFCLALTEVHFLPKAYAVFVATNAAATTMAATTAILSHSQHLDHFIRVPQFLAQWPFLGAAL